MQWACLRSGWAAGAERRARRDGRGARRPDLLSSAHGGRGLNRVRRLAFSVDAQVRFAMIVDADREEEVSNTMNSMPQANSLTSFSTQTIAAIVDVVTGGPGTSDNKPIGLYRSGPVLERFFGNLDIDLKIGSGSRLPSVRDALDDENRQQGGRERIIRVIEACADPRDFIGQEDRLAAVVDHLNKRLRLDGYELRDANNAFRVVTNSSKTVAATALTERSRALDLQSVQDDLDRAIGQAESDPASAITAACSTVESVCKCILDEMNKPYPNKKDIKGLTKEVAEHLQLSPGRRDLPAEWEQDIRTILSGLYNVIGGIGSLRTHAGDAHGRGKKDVKVDARIARLAVHAASTVSLFYIETWQRLVETAKLSR
jgi:hypothetical protein